MSKQEESHREDCNCHYLDSWPPKDPTNHLEADGVEIISLEDILYSECDACFKEWCKKNEDIHSHDITENVIPTIVLGEHIISSEYILYLLNHKIIDKYLFLVLQKAILNYSNEDIELIKRHIEQSEHLYP